MELKEAISIVRKLIKGCSSTGCRIHPKNLGTASMCSCRDKLIDAVPALERILSEFPEPWLRDEDIEWLKEELDKSLKEAEEILSKTKIWPYNTEDYYREIDETEKELIAAQNCNNCFRCLDKKRKENNELCFHRMILCSICGNKRCPHATDHRLKCTGSNEPNQKGSKFSDDWTYEESK